MDPRYKPKPTNDGAVWKDKVAVFLETNGPTDLAVLGHKVPRPQEYKGTLSVLLSGDTRFLLSDDTNIASLSMGRLMAPCVWSRKRRNCQSLSSLRTLVAPGSFQVVVSWPQWPEDQGSTVGT